MKYALRLVLFLLTCTFSFALKAQANVCAVFPALAQSHSSTGTVWLYQSSKIEQKSDQELTLGFNPSKSSILEKSCSNGAGYSYRCGYDMKKIVSPLLHFTLPNLPTSLDVIVDNKKMTLGGKGECLSTTSTACQYNDLTISNKGTLVLSPGTYWFNRISLASGATLQILKNAQGLGKVTIYARSINVREASQIDSPGFPDEFLLLLKEDSFFAGTANFNALIYSEASVRFSETVSLTGAVTSRDLELTGNAKIVGKSQCFSSKLALDPLSSTGSYCAPIPVTFKITDDQGLLQSNISGTLVATASPNTACWGTNPRDLCVSGANEKTVTLENGKTTLWLRNRRAGAVAVSGSFVSPATGPNTLSTKGGPYTFTASGGFRFVNSSSGMVAGKPESLTIEAVDASCSTVNIAYDGPKDLEIGETNYLSPGYLASAPEKLTVNGKKVSQVIKVDFAKGVAKAALTVTYKDVGTVWLPVTDVTPPTAPVAEEGAGGAKNNASSDATFVQAPPLSGNAFLDVRPYTFAICNLSATTGPLSPFAVAGSAFSLSLRPVLWMKGDRQDSAPVALNSDYCLRNMTPSFAHVGAPKANVAMGKAPQVVSPTAASGGQNATLSGQTSKLNTQDSVNNKGMYQFSDLTLNDVGTFSFTSELETTYLGMTVNPGTLDIGRFYPSHFAVTSKSFTAGILDTVNVNKKDFTYMGQPFHASYSVQAMTAKGTPVKNYHLFDAKEKASFNDWAISSTSPSADLTARWMHPALDLNNAWTSGATGSEVNLSANMTLNKTTAADGPYSPLRFAVGVDVPDIYGTDFKFCGLTGLPECSIKVIVPVSGKEVAEFATGEFLFGFMRIQGFTETNDLSRDQTMPVTIEYFNGSTFELNTRDNHSAISTTFAKKEVLFSDAMSDISRQAKIELRDDAQKVIERKTVKAGTSSFYVVAPSQKLSLNREQFSYSLMLGELTAGDLYQPWLQHNWQGAAFTDDPSAIGTYGFYRGSDRIIYQGEKNITVAEE